jgi:hypothetical protein
MSGKDQAMSGKPLDVIASQLRENPSSELAEELISKAYALQGAIYTRDQELRMMRCRVDHAERDALGSLMDTLKKMVEERMR